MKHGMKKLLAVLLSAVVCLGTLPTAAFAQESSAPGAQCICTALCDGEHVNAECPVCGAENADLGQCVGAPAAQCVCTALCDGEHVNAECPVCGADNADLSLCVGTAKAPVDEQVQAVQNQIDALPTAEAVRAMTDAEQGAVYDNLQAAYDAYEALNEEQKDQISGEEIFESLFAVFNSMIDLLDERTAGAFTITGNTEGYSYSDGVLTVQNGADITISMKDGATTPTSDRIVVAEGATATITLNGVNITAPGAIVEKLPTEAISPKCH